MKKIINIIVVVALIFTFSGCSENVEQKSDKLKIVTTIFPPFDFACQVTVGKADVQMLITAGADSHSYEPAPADIVKVQEADIFICVGGESDVWANQILNSIDTSNMTIIKLMDIVTLLPQVELNHDEHEGHSDDEKIEYDQHVWTSIKNSVLISKKIAEEVSRLDPQNADYYKENLDYYVDELNELDKEYQTAVDNATNKMLIFGDRFPFRYLANDYGLSYYAAFDGCSTDTDTSTSKMSFLIEKAKALNVKAVYYIEFSSQKIADSIAAETGAEALLLHSCHNVTYEQFQNAVTYTELMKNNLENLRKGLN